MIITSIDLMKGKAVQLIGGEKKALERNNPVQLAQEFNRFGETAVIDLDAAKNTGDNRPLIKGLCRTTHCRVGGGIRSVEQAAELLSYGAKKIIVGSKAFENNTVNIPFLKDLAQAIGKNRIIVAVDAKEQQIVVNGWRTRTGLDLFNTARRLEPYVSELLFTCVEKEGRSQGADMESIKKLRKIFSKPLTAAGGVHTLQEIETLAQMNVDVQLGMALYTGKIKLDEAFIASLNWKDRRLPVITTDPQGRVLMQAYTDKTALQKTFETGNMWYFSRSRKKLWMKGETSGNFQKVMKLRADCDRDTILATVDQTGPACHLETDTCFGDKNFSLQDLYHVIQQRFANPSPGSYTAGLDHKKVREKLMEEAQEVVEAETRENVIWEAADVLYFLTVLLQKENVTIDDVLTELHKRRLRRPGGAFEKAAPGPPQNFSLEKPQDIVSTILEDVKRNGDAAVKAYTQRFDSVTLDAFNIDKQTCRTAYKNLDTETIQALENSAQRLKTFAQKQLDQLKNFEIETAPGIRAGQRVVPLDRVGVYVPGGRYPLVSSLLMGAIPARTAGVGEIVVCTPPGPDGAIHPAILAAAEIANVDEIYAVGGVQAIGALAYGTETIRPVQKIVGPGNSYVTAAKKEVYGQVGIDFIAGPSEVMIIADDHADPQWIAADLLAQAEHDPLAVPILVTTSHTLARQVEEAVESQLTQLTTRDIAAQAMQQNGRVIPVKNLEEAVEIANREAPEHLELHVREPEQYVDRFKSYGTLFIGKYAAEVLGDYSSGLNHTLPTAGAARYTGGLSVRDFIKVLTTLHSTAEGVAHVGPDARLIAQIEGLNAHENAVCLRVPPAAKTLFVKRVPDSQKLLPK